MLLTQQETKPKRSNRLSGILRRRYKECKRFQSLFSGYFQAGDYALKTLRRTNIIAANTIPKPASVEGSGTAAALPSPP